MARLLRALQWIAVCFSCTPWAIFLLFAGLTLTSGCATNAPRSKISYSAPSVAPVRQKITEAQTAVASAKTHAEKAKSAVAAAVSAASRSDLNLQLATASTELNSLANDLTLTTNALLESHDRVTELDGKVSLQTSQLNSATDDKNVALARADKLDAQRRAVVAQRNKLLFLIAVLTIWILRKPLISGAGFIARKFVGIPI
jgi:chromosome segregation ATPase